VAGDGEPESTGGAGDDCCGVRSGHADDRMT
jgi:hypothetical protein